MGFSDLLFTRQCPMIANPVDMVGASIRAASLLDHIRTEFGYSEFEEASADSSCRPVMRLRTQLRVRQAFLRSSQQGLRGNREPLPMLATIQSFCSPSLQTQPGNIERQTGLTPETMTQAAPHRTTATQVLLQEANNVHLMTSIVCVSGK